MKKQYLEELSEKLGYKGDINPRVLEVAKKHMQIRQRVSYAEFRRMAEVLSRNGADYVCVCKCLDAVYKILNRRSAYKSWTNAIYAEESLTLIKEDIYKWYNGNNRNINSENSKFPERRKK